MALPNLNQQTYELNVPSTDEKIKYRPFLVKEEKLLVQAQEENKPESITRALNTIIDNCTFNKIKSLEKMPSFDLEYIFLNIRAKSVGEIAKIQVKAPDDNETMVPVEIDLTKVNVHVDENHTNKIELTDDVGVVMTYPTMEMFIEYGEDATSTENIFNVMSKCILQIYNGEEVYDKEDTTDDERKDFLENLTQSQFLKIQQFFQTMPKLRHEVTVTNPKTKKKGKVTIEGLRSFF